VYINTGTRLMFLATGSEIGDEDGDGSTVGETFEEP
jgi:hypothetical protein